ncbi:MAG: rhomboid family intramembrane serine protease [Spirochaetales bacterium]|nr:rhomboid family intramembrane serine protease [Spirochaetales bacterium]
MRLKYNAPISLSFGLICTFILICDQYLVPGLVQGVFTAEGALTFQLDDFPAYIRLLTHSFGHANWDHLLQNLTFILLLGPVLEDKYGSGKVAFMMLITTLINGLLNALFFPTELLGASGIAFMMILLTSFAGSREKEIPISFLAVLGLYLVKEFLNIFKNDDISQMSHIVGGLCGAFYGLFLNFFTKLPAGKNKSGGSAPPSSGNAPPKETVIQ